MRMKKILLAAMGLGVGLWLGCAAKGPSKEEAAPFEAAITAYLKQNSMGMKVVEFKSLAVTGDTAKATAALQEAEGLYGLKVKWEFSFRRDESGWKAESYNALQ